jgi:MFS family permease
LSNSVPILFSAAGKTPGVVPGLGIASVATMGYLGFLAGPPVIGFAADLVGLRWALGLVAVYGLLIAVFARAVSDQKPHPPTM